jgi:hypothetical protein
MYVLYCTVLCTVYCVLYCVLCTVLDVLRKKLVEFVLMQHSWPRLCAGAVSPVFHSPALSTTA